MFKRLSVPPSMIKRAEEAGATASGMTSCTLGPHTILWLLLNIKILGSPGNGELVSNEAPQ